MAPTATGCPSPLRASATPSRSTTHAGGLGPDQVARAAGRPGSRPARPRSSRARQAAIIPSACLRHFGADVSAPRPEAMARRITSRARPSWRRAIVVPGRSVLGRFPLVRRCIVPGSDVILERRDHQSAAHRAITTLREMGADIEVLRMAQRRRRGDGRSARARLEPARRAKCLRHGRPA